MVITVSVSLSTNICSKSAELFQDLKFSIECREESKGDYCSFSSSKHIVKVIVRAKKPLPTRPAILR